MSTISLLRRHVRFVLKGRSDINRPLPVMPPFRQRLFPRQHASEYLAASRICYFAVIAGFEGRDAAQSFCKVSANRAGSARDILVQFSLQKTLQIAEHIWAHCDTRWLRARRKTWRQLKGAFYLASRFVRMLVNGQNSFMSLLFNKSPMMDWSSKTVPLLLKVRS